MIEYTKELNLLVRPAAEKTHKHLNEENRGYAIGGKMQTVQIMEETLESESNEIALYFAMSRKAEEEGYTEIAQYLKEIAMDEAWHAAEFAMLLGKIKDTASNLETMLEDEIKTEREKEDAAKVAISEGYDNASRVFIWSMYGERNHKEGIKKVLSKLREKVKSKITHH